MCIWRHQIEGRDTTFIMGHALLKKAILHLKRANGRFILQGTVYGGHSGEKMTLFVVVNSYLCAIKNETKLNPTKMI